MNMAARARITHDPPPVFPVFPGWARLPASTQAVQDPRLSRRGGARRLHRSRCHEHPARVPCGVSASHSGAAPRFWRARRARTEDEARCAIIGIFGAKPTIPVQPAGSSKAWRCPRRAHVLCRRQLGGQSSRAAARIRFDDGLLDTRRRSKGSDSRAGQRGCSRGSGGQHHQPALSAGLPAAGAVARRTPVACRTGSDGARPCRCSRPSPARATSAWRRRTLMATVLAHGLRSRLCTWWRRRGRPLQRSLAAR